MSERQRGRRPPAGTATADPKRWILQHSWTLHGSWSGHGTWDLQGSLILHGSWNVQGSWILHGPWTHELLIELLIEQQCRGEAATSHRRHRPHIFHLVWCWEADGWVLRLRDRRRLLCKRERRLLCIEVRVLEALRGELRLWWQVVRLWQRDMRL